MVGVWMMVNKFIAKLPTHFGCHHWFSVWLYSPATWRKLIFRIAVEGAEPVSVERMWVIVRSSVPGGYIGMLDNEPDAIAKNDELWLGTELLFEYRHIILIDSGNEKTRRLAGEPAPIPWMKVDPLLH
ncbi:MAG TPA: hypothetical protein VKR31_17150 [Rhizomicrobium sp.]|nr:hypothetical protein [Rhizomicrobium sp.]